MALITSSGFAHVRLTVTDIQASKNFYDQVFGWPTVADESAKAGDAQVRESPEQMYGGVVYQTPSGAQLGLRPVAPSGDGFDSTRTGLDHVSFTVSSRAELDSARDALKDLGAPHGDVIELNDFGIAILSFSDPDGIHLELSAQL